MRTFHSSGSCTLETNPNIVKLMYNSLEDIIQIPNEKSCRLIFNRILTQFEIDELSIIPGFIKNINVDMKTHIEYSDLYNVVNQDVSIVIKNINALLKMEIKEKLIIPIEKTYLDFIKYISSIGNVYSTFIEIILCNMYLTKDDQILRYALSKNINSRPNLKLGVKQLNKIVSKLLGLLYEPNEITISRYSDSTINIPKKRDTIFEKFWEGKY